MKLKLKEYKKQYFDNYQARTMLVSTVSFLINAMIGVGKLILGIFLSSNWFISTAIYYLLLCATRGQTLRWFKETQNQTDPYQKFDAQFRIYRRAGIFICLIGASYLLVCLYMYKHGGGGQYPFYLQYGIAAVSFYKISMAIYGMCTIRRRKNPVLSALKTISFVDACVSIVAVQYALLTMESPKSASSSSAGVGMVCSVLFIGIGFFMIVRKKRYPVFGELDKKRSDEKKSRSLKTRLIFLKKIPAFYKKDK